MCDGVLQFSAIDIAGFKVHASSSVRPGGVEQLIKQDRRRGKRRGRSLAEPDAPLAKVVGRHAPGECAFLNGEAGAGDVRVRFVERQGPAHGSP